MRRLARSWSASSPRPARTPNWPRGAAGRYVSADREASVPTWPSSTSSPRRSGRRRHRVRSVPAPARVRCSQGRGLLGSGASAPAGRGLRDVVVPAGQLLIRPGGVPGPAKAAGRRSGTDPPDRSAAAPAGPWHHLAATAARRRDRWSLRTCWLYGRVRERRRRLGGQQPLSPRELSRIGSAPPLARWRSTTCTGIVTRTGRTFPFRMLRRRRRSARTRPARHDRHTARFHAAGVEQKNDVWAARAYQATTPLRSPGWSTTCLPDAPIRPPWPAPGARLSSSAVHASALLGKGSCGTSWCRPPLLRRPERRDGCRRHHRSDDLTAPPVRAGQRGEPD